MKTLLVLLLSIMSSQSVSAENISPVDELYVVMSQALNGQAFEVSGIVTEELGKTPKSYFIPPESYLYLQPTVLEDRYNTYNLIFKTVNEGTPRKLQFDVWSGDTESVYRSYDLTDRTVTVTNYKDKAFVLQSFYSDVYEANVKTYRIIGNPYGVEVKLISVIRMKRDQPWERIYQAP